MVCDIQEVIMLKCSLCQDVKGILHQCGKHPKMAPLYACLLVFIPLCNPIRLSLGEGMTHSYPTECDRGNTKGLPLLRSTSIHTKDSKQLICCWPQSRNCL